LTAGGRRTEQAWCEKGAVQLSVGETKFRPGDFDALFSSTKVARDMASVAPECHAAAAAFWRVPLDAPLLTARMKELILFAMHASAASLNVEAIQRQMTRALAAGARKEDIIDVLVSIVALANHALYGSVPILQEELRTAGIAPQQHKSDDAAFEAAKQRFIRIREFWNPDRDALARMMPDYFAVLTDLSVASWQHGSLTRKEREFICIGIDCTVTHTYGPGLRIHIRNAIAQGATEQEILEIFQLAATMGLEAYFIAAEALFGQQRDGKSTQGPKE
jgi:alkylhydroperoxidase/carboxymuconolactone decarboxylase family protein YurZ